MNLYNNYSDFFMLSKLVDARRINGPLTHFTALLKTNTTILIILMELCNQI